MSTEASGETESVPTATATPIAPAPVQVGRGGVQLSDSGEDFRSNIPARRIVHALNELACDASEGTQKALEAAIYLLSYIACSPKPKARLHASGMKLLAGSGAASHARPKGRSRAGGYFYLGSRSNEQLNAPIFALAKATKGAMGSAAEAEAAATHMNAKEAIPARQCLEEMGWAQPPARARAGSAAAGGFASSAAKPKRSEAFGRQLWRLKGREEQKHFEVAWEAGAYSLAGYPTKQRSPAHRKKARPACLHEEGRSPRAAKEREAILASLKPAKKAQSAAKSYKCLLAAAAA